MRGRAAVLALLVLCMPLSGCLSDAPSAEGDGDDDDRLRLEDRHLVEWNWTGSYSRVLEDGPHTALPVQEALIEVDTSDIWETGPSTSEVHLSYWLLLGILDLKMPLK